MFCCIVEDYCNYFHVLQGIYYQRAKEEGCHAETLLICYRLMRNITYLKVPPSFFSIRVSSDDACCMNAFCFWNYIILWERYDMLTYDRCLKSFSLPHGTLFQKIYEIVGLIVLLFLLVNDEFQVVEPMVDLCAVPCSWSQVLPHHHKSYMSFIVCTGL